MAEALRYVIQGVIFTVSIVISCLLSLPSCYLGNEVAERVGKKAFKKLKMDKICRPGPFRMTRPKCSYEDIIKSIYRKVDL